MKANTIKEAINILQRNKIRNIELTAGTNYYNGVEDDLINLKIAYKHNYICHHYFPPAEEPFVLNLASLDNDIYQKTLYCLEKAIKLSKKLNAAKFGLHAGLFLDIEVDELGGDFRYHKLFDRGKCLKRFCEGFNILKKLAGNLELYIENNVISCANFKKFEGLSPFMMTNYQEYLELSKLIDFKLLLDIGHLKVSSASLGSNFEDELDKMIAFSDYLHISDNNGLSDQNRHLSSESDLLPRLKNHTLRDKIITLEICDKMENIKKTYNLLTNLIR